MFTGAGKAEIIRSNQKDEFYSTYIRGTLAELTQSILGALPTLFNLQYSKTRGCCCFSLGEEIGSSDPLDPLMVAEFGVVSA